mmetsp:Transcript_19750/g.48527  ORF Transcript_19750/g.48527 Transcript_19750/m.48527 type:complete len:322 (+) Transcript_19750:282-1247(+)|eukprot:CAMPEP_0113644454 /NCGR_PEP_ID=MMETSP0017_2-20120614/23401_1 /TAXON_ID=2856 /ORGANISM="Cylindrotheca closterium" /LENGTH=321 /DNA_ID=CAMNT_0000556075 /DNA_START=195 /DNA_END=1160 /DNA_ORIENTATION=- /assembly_acc=CAM_ASM_000147
MKFLENEKLIELTGQLSEATLGQSHRIINGRIEAYTMKRAGNDKKFAHTLGQKFIADLEEQQQLLHDLTQVAASQRAADTSLLSSELSEKPKQRRKRSNSATSFLEAISKKKPKSGRARSQSVDITLHTNKHTLGDISELATRRLMTDLILTLNASFPDYDFSNAKPQQFEKLGLARVQRGISERLSELATLRKLDATGKLPNSSSNVDLVVEIFSALDSVVSLKECDIYSFEDESFLDESDHLWSFHYFFVNKSLRRLVFFTCSEHIDVRDEDASEETEPEIMMPSEFQMLENSEFDYSNTQGDAVFSGTGMSVPLYSTI